MKIEYENWKVEIKSDMLIVEKFNEVREYDLPNWKTVTHKGGYIYIILEDKTTLQFKMEEEDFFVGDKFDEEGEHIDTIASHVFGEDFDEEHNSSLMFGVDNNQ